MAGETIVALARMMEEAPQVGIIQTAPTIVNRESLFARVQQFTSRVYGLEAALMGRAGFEVWLAYDLPGSYEESPPNILDELKRDRRWCQGNLQHLRLLAGDGIRFGHRAIMGMGIMAYASAFLWAVFFNAYQRRGHCAVVDGSCLFFLSAELISELADLTSRIDNGPFDNHWSAPGVTEITKLCFDPQKP